MELCLRVALNSLSSLLGLVNEMVYSADLDALYVLAASTQIIRIDLSVAPVSATNGTLLELGCKLAVPTTAMKSVTVSGATLTDMCEPLVPAMTKNFVPVVSGVGNEWWD